MCKEKQDRSDHLEKAVVQILVKAKRHPISFRGLQKEIARKIDSQKDARINLVLKELVDREEVLIVEGSAEPEYFWRDNLGYLKARLCEILRVHHTKRPYEPGMKTGEIKKSFSKTQTQNKKRNIDARLFELVFSACKEDGFIVEAEAGVRLSDFVATGPLDEEIAGLEKAVLRHVIDRRHQRMDIDKLSVCLGRERRLTKAVLARSVAAGKLIKIKEGRYLEPSEIEQARRVLSARLGDGSRMHLSRIVQALGQSRRAVISMMEYFDRIGFTRRDGDYRELARVSDR